MSFEALDHKIFGGGGEACPRTPREHRSASCGVCKFLQKSAPPPPPSLNSWIRHWGWRLYPLAIKAVGYSEHRRRAVFDCTNCGYVLILISISPCRHLNRKHRSRISLWWHSGSIPNGRHLSLYETSNEYSFKINFVTWRWTETTMVYYIQVSFLKGWGLTRGLARRMVANWWLCHSHVVRSASMYSYGSSLE